MLKIKRTTMFAWATFQPCNSIFSFTIFQHKLNFSISHGPNEWSPEIWELWRERRRKQKYPNLTSSYRFPCYLGGPLCDLIGASPTRQGGIVPPASTWHQPSMSFRLVVSQRPVIIYRSSSSIWQRAKENTQEHVVVDRWWSRGGRTEKRCCMPTSFCRVGAG